MRRNDLKRREFIRYSALGLGGATLPGRALPPGRAERSSKGAGPEESLRQKVLETPLIDTHEHLMNESERIKAGRSIEGNANDWTFLLSHYFDSDLVAAGMSQKDHDLFYSPALGAACLALDFLFHQ